MPTAKRARQKAAREARMEALRKAQQRRKSYRRGGVIGGIVVIAVVLAIVTTTGGGGASVSTVPPLSTANLDAALAPHAAPALSSDCSSKGTTSTSTTTVPAKGHEVSIVPAPAGIGFPNLNGSSPRYTSFSAAPPFCIDVSKTYTATVKTDIGNVTIQLLPKYAPLTVNNFVFLAGYHYFNGTVFHRVVKG
ncbi:MAG: peptidylprolyl isomerase, partial [Acidimicrobiales bacterium]